MEKMDATTMVNVIKDIFLRLGLDCIGLAKLRGHCYDVSSTMMEKNKGVATLIKRDANFLQSAIHTFVKFTRRSIMKTKKSLVVGCKL